jgi:ribonuclease-3
MKNTLIDIQNKIKVKFNDLSLLERSLVHKSFDYKNNNEKLEFLGDRVLGLILSKTLLFNYPDEKEGIIDKKFANLVNKKTCAKIAKEIDIIKYMTIGDSYRGIKKSKEKIGSDCLEALIGAIYLDKGVDVAEKFILLFWKEDLAKSNLTPIDAKTKLQEHSLKTYKELPKYNVFKQSGPQHSPIFRVDVQIPNSKKITANGSSKKDAQQNAAKKLIKDLKI